MKNSRGTSESSTTSDNTTEFIDIVKKYDVVYNTHNPDYKNVEVKMKVWSQIAEEINLSVDASKRKWKNLRDSYTKYLRSFRTGTKTSKKYQYWAHAEHMDFLKPYQGPGRNCLSTIKSNDEEESECDLGLQVLTKAQTSPDDDLKISTATSQPVATITPALTSNTTAAHSALSPCCMTTGLTSSGSITTATNSIAFAIPSLPTVQLPPPLTSKPILSTLPTSAAAQVFPLPQLSANTGKTTVPMPSSSAASSVGCLIIEPHLFAPTDTFKKELNLSGMLNPFASHAPVATTTSSKMNSSMMTKVRRVQPSPQATAINLSYSALQPPPAKVRKGLDVDVSTILQANRDLDANTLFFLSLGKTVRSMPVKYQSLAKMRCMRIVSDLELELENANDCNGSSTDDQANGNGNKFCNSDYPSPPGSTMQNAPSGNETSTEHFVYVMSPSRVESMIDISSDEEGAQNGG